MCDCHSILECCAVFSGVKFSIRSFNLFMLIIGDMLSSGFEVLVHYFFPQWAIYVQDCTSLPNALGLLTIYAQNIIIQQVIKFSVFLFKLTAQVQHGMGPLINMQKSVFFAIVG